MGFVKQKKLFFTVFVLVLLFPFVACAEKVPEGGTPSEVVKEKDDYPVMSLIYENDIFGGTDQNYTNGVRIALLSPESKTPDWARFLANNVLPFAQGGSRRVSLALGQNMYTPTDLARTDIIPEDRPYAGWLYASLGVISDTGKQLDNAMLTIGIVGPHSFAEETQKFVHSTIGSPMPHGWDHQLKDEPGIMLSFERKWRNLYELKPFGFGIDVTPHVGVNLGNVHTDASVGTTFRFGYDLPSDYGPPRIRPSLPGSDFFYPSKRLAWYFFTALEGRAVARNIFLDGNSFASSHNVEKEPFVGTAQLGVALTYDRVRLSYTHILMSKEYKSQETPEIFGAVTLSYAF